MADVFESCYECCVSASLRRYFLQMVMFLYLLGLWLFGSAAAIFLYARRDIVDNWKEPVLRRPVMIIESDDWGAGPPDQAGVLEEIARLLADFSDCDGRKPVMTLGMVLATADGALIRASGGYRRQVIGVHTHGALLDAITRGVDAGVFAVQLHGLEHFWPPALLTASTGNVSVRQWLERAPFSLTEDLPSPLQSRWVDASVLPARDLDDADIRRAVKEEVDCFQRVFGRPPRVVVPPTFVWNALVERAWTAAGIGVIVTPGRRHETRGESGEPAGAGYPLHNGQTSEGGALYTVRDVYFEPALGHTAAQAQDALLRRVALGRPALLETHRFNFLGTQQQKDWSLEQLRRLLQDALSIHRSLAFLSTERLASLLGSGDPEWVERALRRRLHVWFRRLWEYPRLRKLACLTGWIVPAGLVWKLTG